MIHSLTTQEFKVVFSLGKRLKSPFFSVISYKGSPGLGIAIAKRSIPKAHQRNDLKRRIRETYRHSCCVDQNKQFVVIAHKSTLKLAKHQINQELSRLWNGLAN